VETPAARPTSPSESAERAAVTSERFSRLHQLVRFLGGGPRTRDKLIGHLAVDVRGFYRDLELLRGAGIGITLQAGAYQLEGGLEDALALLPFPDLHLTLGEVRLLARGRTRAHRHVQEQLERYGP
jgi:hypothetical protein